VGGPSKDQRGFFSMDIHLNDFMFDMPDTLPAGQTLVKVVNDGPDAHELNIAICNIPSPKAHVRSMGRGWARESESQFLRDSPDSSASNP
jgi:hypothetical protein